MKLTYIAKRMIYSILIIALIGIVGSVLFYQSLEFLPFLWGVILGSLTSIVKVVLLDKAVDKALSMDNKKAKNYVGLQHILRLFLSGVVLVLGAVVPQINLWGVVLGILAFQLSVYTVRNVKNAK
ncbi:ATP synthase subunit I [Ruoffia tabacinasalis]|uniref:ATP synthase subunit I n=1 Tax=Ruoffia tabacinasalis TaxID=87458 RepID=A0ABS0LHA0_9LACT|nr:ATP synthase subunit I [Ruoffia tabacinasalis]MBG9977623.1 ATP synthase subunit I [Ruoffia tabacinasalis]